MGIFIVILILIGFNKNYNNQKRKFKIPKSFDPGISNYVSNQIFPLYPLLAPYIEIALNNFGSFLVPHTLNATLLMLHQYLYKIPYFSCAFGESKLYARWWRRRGHVVLDYLACKWCVCPDIIFHRIKLACIKQTLGRRCAAHTLCPCCPCVCGYNIIPFK